MKPTVFFVIAILCLAAGCASPPQEKSVQASAEQSQGAYVASQSEIKDGSVTLFTYEGNKAILVSSGGKYFAYVDKCPKEGCALKYENGQLKCPCCGSVFDLNSGAVLSGPAKAPLTALQVSLIGGNVYASSQ